MVELLYKTLFGFTLFLFVMGLTVLPTLMAMFVLIDILVSAFRQLTTFSKRREIHDKRRII